MNLRPHTPAAGSGRTLRLTLASAATVATLLLVPAAAGAQTQTYGPPPPPTGPEVLPNTGVNPQAQPAAVSPAAVSAGGVSRAAAAPSRRALAVTGGDLAGLAALGGTAVVAGAGLVLASRRRRATV